MGLLIKATRGIIEHPIKVVDKALGNVKCPNPLCRSGNVEKVGKHKWHCRECGRNFKA